MAALALTSPVNLYRLATQTNPNQKFSPKLLDRVAVSQTVERLYFDEDIIVEAVKKDGEILVFYRDELGNAVNEFGEILTAFARINMDAKEPKTVRAYYAIAKAQIDDKGEVIQSDAAITVSGIVKDLMPESIPGILRIVTFSDGTQLSIFHASDGDQPALNFLDSSGNETTKPKGESSNPDEGFKL